MKKIKDDKYELWGNLTIKGITKKIKLDVEFGGVIKDPWGGERAGFTINGKVNRKDWELNWNAHFGKWRGFSWRYGNDCR